MKLHSSVTLGTMSYVLSPLMGFILLFGVLLLSCAQEGDNPAEQTKSSKEISSSEQNEKDREKMDKILHSDFNITRAALEEMLSSLPQEIQGAILKKPGHFLECLSQALDLPHYATVLVDKEHSLSEDYYPHDLVALSDYDLLLNKNDLTLRLVVMPDLLAMVEAAKIESIQLPLSSTFRSYSYQNGLWERNVEKLGLEQASRESARPGTSQHQLGTTIDFGSITDAFADTKAGRWLAQKAWKYGFSMSYPDGYEHLTGYKYESWHFRYITRLGSYIEQEFFQGIQQHYLLFLRNNRDQLEAAGL